MSAELDHERFMDRAIALASKQAHRPFASVIVDRASHQVVAEGWNRSHENPIWHGELDALNRLAELANAEIDNADLVLYTTAEPCPMCQGAILWARIGTVVFGSSIETLARLGWNQIAVSASEINRQSSFHRCELIGGVLEARCDQLYAS